jgi:hypothetical protein
MPESKIVANTDSTEPSPRGSESTEEVTYHAVEKDGVVKAIWEMRGRKLLRTIDPRSRQGQDILRFYTTEDSQLEQKSKSANESSGYDEPVCQIIFPVEESLTPHVLDTVIVPYLKAVEEIQRILDKIIKRKSPDPLTIKSIKQESPVTVTLNGVSDAIQFIKELIFASSREHAKKMAQLTEQDREAEIEKKRLENEKTRMELRRLTLEQLDEFFPDLSKTARIGYARKLLPHLEIVLSKDVEMRMLDDFETRNVDQRVD